MTMDPIEELLGIPTAISGNRMPMTSDPSMPMSALIGSDQAPGLPGTGAAPGQSVPVGSGEIQGPLSGGGSTGQAAVGGGSSTRPPEPPMPFGNTDPAQVDDDFWQRHGRGPTDLELEAMTSAQLLQRNLGRPPLKLEVLQYLSSRNETPQPVASAQVIEEVPPPPPMGI